MPDLTIMIVAAAITGVAALLQGTIGFGFAAISVPLLTLLDPSLTPIPQIMLSLTLATGMAIRERRSIDFSGVRWILVGRTAGAVIGAWLLGFMTERIASMVIGSVVVGAALIMTSGWSIPRTRETETGVGVLSGASGIVTGVGGPMLALLFAGAEGPTTRSTLSTIFIVGQSINIAVLGFTGRTTGFDVQVAALLVIPLILGFLVSSRIRGFVSGQRLRIGIIAASGLAGATLLLQSI